MLADLLRCENVVLNNLPFGFTHEKPRRKVLVQKNSDLTEEYKLPVGGEVIASISTIVVQHAHKCR